MADKLRVMKLREAGELIEAGIEETLSYYEFPSEQWRCLRTNNPLERLMLVAARLRYVAASRWGTRRYLNMQRLVQVAVA